MQRPVHATQRSHVVAEESHVSGASGYQPSPVAEPRDTRCPTPQHAAATVRPRGDRLLPHPLRLEAGISNPGGMMNVGAIPRNAAHTEAPSCTMMPRPRAQTRMAMVAPTAAKAAAMADALATPSRNASPTDGRGRVTRRLRSPSPNQVRRMHLIPWSPSSSWSGCRRLPLISTRHTKSWRSPARNRSVPSGRRGQGGEYGVSRG